MSYIPIIFKLSLFCTLLQVLRNVNVVMKDLPKLKYILHYNSINCDVQYNAFVFVYVLFTCGTLLHNRIISLTWRGRRSAYKTSLTPELCSDSVLIVFPFSFPCHMIYLTIKICYFGTNTVY